MHLPRIIEVIHCSARPNERTGDVIPARWVAVIEAQNPLGPQRVHVVGRTAGEAIMLARREFRGVQGPSVSAVHHEREKRP